MSFSEDIINSVWKKGTPIRDYNPDEYRLDVCGALICRSQYGMNDAEYGWEIDHIIPKSRLENQNFTEEEIDSLINLQPLHRVNNARKSDDYPIFRVGVSHARFFYADEMVEISSQLQQDIKKHFENIKMERLRTFLRRLSI